MRTRIVIAALVGSIFAFGSGARGQDKFIRGDVNADGQIDVADLGRLIDAFILGSPQFPCGDAADVDDTGGICFRRTSGQQAVTPCTFSTDVDFLTAVLLGMSFGVQGAAPPAPFPLPNLDPTQDPLGCADGLGPPPRSPDARFRLDWEAPSVIAPGQKSVELFLRVTTPKRVDGFSLAYLVDTDVLDILSVSFVDTVFPANQRQTYEASRLFRYLVTSSPFPGRSFLFVTSIFATDPASGAPARIAFPATQRALADERLLRIVASVKETAPSSPKPVTLLAPWFGPYPEPFASVGGLRNDFVFEGLLEPVEEEFQSVSMSVVIDEPETLLFVRGDSNTDRAVDISDASHTLGFLFLGGVRPLFLDAADANDDGQVDISDASYTLGYLFSGGSRLPNPFPRCGVDLTDDALLDIVELVILPFCP